ncbi:MAG: DNA repair protein RecO [Phycisphaeraceae bacterium]|nr:DNA repair protein RecO [Phycisphaeraceae bacterium]
MPSTRDQALCIRHWDWSETSQTVSLFTRDHGVIRGIAKGAKRDKAPFSGGIELLTRGEVVAILKPSSDLATITAWDLQETFPGLTRSLEAFHSAMYIADVARHSLHDRDPHPALFDALLTALRHLSSAELPPRKVVLRFLWATLNECGWRPELQRDVLSGAPLPNSGELAFAPSLGGFTSMPDAADSPPGPRWRVRGQTLALLRTLDHPADNADPASIERAGKLLNAYLTTVLGRELPAAAPLFGKL